MESSPARPQSPPPSTSYLECPRTPTRERTPVKTPIVESFASPPRASLLQSSSSGRVSSQNRTPSRQPPPPPPNTPSITQFFAAVAGKAVPKDLAMPVRSAQSVTTGHKRKSSALSDTDKAFCLKKTQKGGKGLSKRMLSSAEDSVDEEWEGNPEESTSTSTSRYRLIHPCDMHLTHVIGIFAKLIRVLIASAALWTQNHRRIARAKRRLATLNFLLAVYPQPLSNICPTLASASLTQRTM